MNGLEEQNTVNLTFTGSDNPNRTVVFFYTPCECSQLKKSEHVDIAVAEVAKTGAIPGLYVYDEIITPQEEAEMIATIDQGTWTKLLNRRVQHYGYEFKYGTNDIDPDQALGGMPPFCDPLIPSKSQISIYTFV